MTQNGHPVSAATRQVDAPIGPITLDQIGPALSLLHAGLGDGYVDEPSLVDCQKNGIVLGARGNGGLVGILLARVLDQSSAREFETLLQNAGATRRLDLTRLGILKSIVVAAPCRGRGIGAALSGAAIERLRQAGCSTLVTVSWASGESSSAGMFERLGFKQLARVAEFWKDDSIRRGYHCPRCGQPCTCAAIVYVLDL